MPRRQQYDVVIREIRVDIRMRTCAKEGNSGRHRYVAERLFSKRRCGVTLCRHDAENRQQRRDAAANRRGMKIRCRVRWRYAIDARE